MHMYAMQKFLIKELINENQQYKDIEIPEDSGGQKKLLRSLMNMRPPVPVPPGFLQIQDPYLQELTKQKRIVDIDKLQPVPLNGKITLWQGDITRLKAGAIVNAANSQLLGCFVPCHGCIDNAIHTYAGVQLRLDCNRIMAEQNLPEPAGKAKITPAYNLPCQYVIHTVGPMIHGSLTQKDCNQLADCYRSSLELAETTGIKSIAFCCISTGEFHFPNQLAAEIAVGTVTNYLKDSQQIKRVVFNVFKDNDREIYGKLLGVY